MTNELKEFLQYYLPHQDLTPFIERFSELKIKKNRRLLKPGMRCDYLAYIQSGCFRVYYYDLKGKEIITWFSFQFLKIPS